LFICKGSDIVPHVKGLERNKPESLSLQTDEETRQGGKERRDEGVEERRDEGVEEREERVNMENLRSISHDSPRYDCDLLNTVFLSLAYVSCWTQK
jgi:hypothetical protein